MFTPRRRRRTPMLDWPDQWGPQRPSAWVLARLLMMAGFAVGSVPYTLAMVWQGTWLAVAAAVGGLVFVAALVVDARYLRVRRTELPARAAVRAVDGTTTGLRVDLRARVKPIVLVFGIAGIVFAFARVMTMAPAIARESRTGGNPVQAVQMFAFVGLAVLCVGGIAWLAVGDKKYFIAFTAVGVVERSGYVCKTIPWDAIESIEPIRSYNAPAVRIVAVEGAIRIDTGRSLLAPYFLGLVGRHIDLRPIGHGLDPALVLWLVRFYRANPERRGELGTDAVITRLTTGGLREAAA